VNYIVKYPQLLDIIKAMVLITLKIYIFIFKCDMEKLMEMSVVSILIQVYNNYNQVPYF